MGVNDRVSSARIVGRNSRVEESRYAPVPVLAADYRRTGNERLYDASVTSARAVVGPPERRCWVEREQVVEEVSTFKIPGALACAVIGGILGHQVGGGRGQDIATAGGAVAAMVDSRCIAATSSAARTWPATAGPTTGTLPTIFAARNIASR